LTLPEVSSDYTQNRVSVFSREIRILTQEEPFRE